MNKNRGFTLIEIIVVMAILAILAVGAIGSYRATMMKRNDLKRKSDLAQMAKAIEIYYQDFGSFPKMTTNGRMNACGDTGQVTCNWGDMMKQGVSPNEVIYMAELPSDPKSTQTYYYLSDASGTFFKLYARLENLDDQDALHDGSGNPDDYNDPIGLLKCGKTTLIECNFGVTSTNKVLN